MQRYLLIAGLTPVLIGVLAGCPSQSDDQAEASLTADAGSAGAADHGARQRGRDGAEAQAGAARDDMQTGQVVRNLYEQRSQIEAELEVLAASPATPPDKIRELKQELEAINGQLLDLAQADYEGVEAELAKLAADDAKIAADWQQLIADPTAAPSIPEGIDDLPLAEQAGGGIGLAGQPEG